MNQCLSFDVIMMTHGNQIPVSFLQTAASEKIKVDERNIFLKMAGGMRKKIVYFAAFLSQACYRSSFPAGRGVNNSHVYQHLAEAPPIRLTVGLRFKAFPSQRNIGDSPLNKKKQTKALMVQKYSVFARGKCVSSIFPSKTFLRRS